MTQNFTYIFPRNGRKYDCEISKKLINITKIKLYLMHTQRGLSSQTVVRFRSSHRSGQTRSVPRSSRDWRWRVRATAATGHRRRPRTRRHQTDTRTQYVPHVSRSILLVKFEFITKDYKYSMSQTRLARHNKPSMLSLRRYE